MHSSGKMATRAVLPASYPFRSGRLPLLIRSISRSLSPKRLPFLNFDEQALLRKASQLTGLDDFGDHSFYEGFSVLIKSIKSDAHLNLIGHICFRSDILRILCNRLRMQEDRKRHPHIADQVIIGPIFITGFPRTGSTLLHALLAQDMAIRVPQVWEVMYPSPPPESCSYNYDHRISRTAKDLKWLNVIMPGFKRVHLIDARLPQECIAITAHAFISYLFESMYFVDYYRTWHDDRDKRPAYEYHKQFLQHLQCHTPGTHWVLKAPSHLFSLGDLMQIYPDAKIILTHRDPLEVLPSCASFTEVLRGAFTDHIDREKLGIEIARHWQRGARLAVEFSQNSGNAQDRFLNVLYTELIREPMAVVRRIYDHFDMELTDETELAMQRFLAQNPQNVHGAHRYSLEEFGLDPGAEARRWEAYTSFFGIN